jgi:bifunctional DNase/RNase
MKIKELKILGLSYSQGQLGSYVIVLSDIRNNIKLPIIIKSNEAQRIALELEGIKPPRPMIHDLFKSMGEFYRIDIQEIFIHSLLEGIFYTKIITSNGLDEIEIDCSAGDAIALSVLYKCPIYTTSDILKKAGVVINDDGTQIEDIDLDSDIELDDDIIYKDRSRVLSIEDLENMMNEAINNEEYEIAAEIRDRIEELKKSK